MTRPRLILASASPRRSELLAGLGVDFERRPVEIDESPSAGEEAEAYGHRLAREKAAAAIAQPADLVLAADTIVVLDGELLGKPHNRQDAMGMLGRLAGREHVVLTGVCLLEAGSDRSECRVDRTRVFLKSLTRAEVEWYAGTGEPDDKAGSYALQGLGGLFVERLDGSSSNVIGLPLHVVYELFNQLGHDFRRFCRGPR